MRNVVAKNLSTPSEYQPFAWPKELDEPAPGLEAVQIARSEEAKQKIFEIRYSIYIEKQKKTYAADHEHRMLSDSLDETAIHLFTLETSGQNISAAVRINSGSDPLAFDIARKEFKLDHFLEIATPDQFHFYSRLVTSSDLAINRSIARIFQRGYVINRKCGVRFIFCRTMPHLLPFFEKLGFVQYGVQWADPVAGNQICVVALPPDQQHLEAVRSPIRHVAPLFPHDNSDRIWLRRKFPDQIF